MQHIKNTETCGIYKDHEFNTVTGPKLYKAMPVNRDNLICNRTLTQIKAMQQGNKAINNITTIN